MQMADVSVIALALDGVKESRAKGLRKWTVGGRLVARQYDSASIVVQTRFGERNRLVAEHPDVCSVPLRFDVDMKVVLRLPDAEPDLVADALQAAWSLQRIVD
jgi:hypothetical protein